LLINLELHDFFEKKKEKERKNLHIELGHLELNIVLEEF